MKKILPILTILSLPVALCACNDDHEKANTSFDAYQRNIANFQNYFKEYSSASDSQLNKLVLNKYRLNLSLPEDSKLVNGLTDTQAKTANQLPSNANNNEQVKIVPNGNQTNVSETNTETPALDEQQPTTLPDNSQDRPIVDTPSVQPIKPLADTNSAKKNNTFNANLNTNTNENIIDNNIDNSNQTNKKDETVSNDTSSTDNTNNVSDNADSTNKTTSEQTSTSISTLYSLTADVDEQCNQFCELKKQLNNAITETQNLIEKVNKNEIELTNEQRMFLTEQSAQLKALGKRLTAATTELSFSVSDLGKIINTGSNYDQLAMKYLLVLDNLYNGNDMLENGIYQLNMINQLMNMQAPVAGNNIGRILYGFRQNGNAPVIYDYVIDKDGNLTQNSTNNDNNNETDSTATDNTDNANQSSDQNNNGATKDVKDTNTSNTTKHTWLTPNIDTFGNYRSNIDTFFNTALLNRYGMNGFNNGFGYGGYGAYGGLNGFASPMQNSNNFYGGNGFGNAYNPYIAYNNLNKNDYYAAPDNVLTNTTNGVQNQLNTQDNQQTQNKTVKPKLKFTKNIDTYKTANTPTPKQRFAKIKDSVNGFFAKFKKPKKDDIQNPTYRLEPAENSSTDES